MPRRIVIPDRIIIHKTVSIPCLCPLRPGRDNAIRLGKAVKITVVPARVEIVNSKFRFITLPCKMVVRAEIAVSIPRLTEGFVERGGGLDSVRVRVDGGTAEVVGEEEGESPVRAAPRGDSGRARKVIFRDNGVLDFVVIANLGE
jgi:hypothetical protein